MKEKLRLLCPAILLTALAVITYYLLRNESDYLWKAQELNLFLDTPLFLKQQMVEAGWLLMWLGSWFTEFFYHPWIGVTLLCLWWALLMFVTGRTFRIPMKWATLLLIPVAALLLSDVSLGYWLYYLKLRGVFFAATIGTTIAVANVWLFRLMPQRFFLRQIYVAVSTAVLYPLIGFYGLVSTLLCGVLTWRLDDMKRNRRLLTSAVALLSIAFFPLFYYNYVFYQTNIVNILWQGLPLFFIDKEYATYYIPYYILVASLIAFALLYRRQPETAVKSPLKWGICQVVLLAALVYGVQRYWYKDYNFHKELTMQRLMANLDWEGVRQEAASLDDEPTRAIVLMKNLALFRLGRQGDTMYNYRTGAKASDAPFPVAMVDIIGVPLYFHYGQYNYGYRWCMEDGVERGWRAEMLKNFVRCTLVSGEPRIARKYLNLLKHTRYHKEWASRYETLLDQKKLHADSEFEPVFHLTRCNDVLGSDNTIIEKFIMNQFASNPSTDPLYQEQAVYAAIWTKDIPTFWRNFFPYARSHMDQRMPTHLQEAAYLYGQLEKTVDTSNMPFDESVVQTYQELMKEAQQYANMSEEGMARALYPRFGQTYYYDYYFVRNQKLY
jgi:hypothetical protein